MTPPADIILYQTEDGRTRLTVRLDDGTVWLTQAELAALYQTTPQNITIHIAAIRHLRRRRTRRDRNL